MAAPVSYSDLVARQQAHLQSSGQIPSAEVFNAVKFLKENRDAVRMIEWIEGPGYNLNNQRWGGGLWTLAGLTTTSPEWGTYQKHYRLGVGITYQGGRGGGGPFLRLGRL